MSPTFTKEMLDRCVVSEEECERFKATAQRREFIDEDQLWRLVCYVGKDGHILVEEMVRL